MPRIAAPPGTQAVVRAFGLLKVFSVREPRQRVAALSRACGLTKTTTLRLLAALESEGLVTKGSDGSYSLGPGVIALGSQALLTSDLRACARPFLEQVARETGETTTLDVPVGGEILILDGVAGRHVVSATLDVGTRWPAHLTSTGKCILALLPEANRERVLAEPLKRFTRHTITDRAVLREELEDVRRRGYASAVEELEEDYTAVAAAFRDAAGNVEGAISIGGPVSRLDSETVERIGARLIEAAEALSRARAQTSP